MYHFEAKGKLNRSNTYNTSLGMCEETRPKFGVVGNKLTQKRIFLNLIGLVDQLEFPYDQCNFRKFSR